jgi:hypothetical protein
MRQRAVRESSGVRLQLARTLWRRGTPDRGLRVGLVTRAGLCREAKGRGDGGRR